MSWKLKQRYIHFTHYKSDTLFSFDRERSIFSNTKNTNFKFKDCVSGQIGSSLYTFKQFPLIVTRYDNLSVTEEVPAGKMLAALNQNRMDFALSSYRSRSFYLTGGIQDIWDKETNKVLEFSLLTNKFRQI